MAEIRTQLAQQISEKSKENDPAQVSDRQSDCCQQVKRRLDRVNRVTSKPVTLRLPARRIVHGVFHSGLEQISVCGLGYAS